MLGDNDEVGNKVGVIPFAVLEEKINSLKFMMMKCRTLTNSILTCPVEFLTSRI